MFCTLDFFLWLLKNHDFIKCELSITQKYSRDDLEYLTIMIF